jgi:hypothetical protein
MKFSKRSHIDDMTRNQVEKLLWSIALPGLGQLLNKKYIKGLLLIFLEFLINVQAHFNQIIMFSFQGKIESAIQTVNYQWLMFYPCVYFFGLWDAVRDAQDEHSAFSFVPYVITAYSITVGVIYSDKLKIFGVLWGPVWLPILFCFFGVAIGLLLKKIFTLLTKQA